MYFFFDGKTVVKYCNDGLGENKGIFKLPSLVGYQEGNAVFVNSDFEQFMVGIDKVA